MVTGSAGGRGAQVGSLAKPERRGLPALRLFGHKLSPLAQIGLAIIAINLLVALFAPWIAPYDQATPVGDPGRIRTSIIGSGSTISAAIC